MRAIVNAETLNGEGFHQREISITYAHRISVVAEFFEGYTPATIEVKFLHEVKIQEEKNPLVVKESK